MHDIQELHDRRAVIADGDFGPVVHELVHAPRPSVERTASTTAPQALMLLIN